MHGSPATFSRELTEVFAEIERYGHALNPASGTLVLRRSPGRITDAVMPRVSIAVPRAPAGRPWTLSAAMEPVPEHRRFRLDGRTRHDAGADAAALYLSSGRRSRRAIFATVALCLLLAGAGTLLLLRAYQRPAASPPRQRAAVALTALRTVAAAMPNQAATAPTTRTFPRGTHSILIDVRYRGQTVDPLTFLVVSRSASTAAVATVLQRSYVLTSGGEAVIPLEAPGGGFTSGTYTVMAQWHGELLGGASFTVP